MEPEAIPNHPKWSQKPSKNHPKSIKRAKARENTLFEVKRSVGRNLFPSRWSILPCPEAVLAPKRNPNGAKKSIKSSIDFWIHVWRSFLRVLARKRCRKEPQIDKDVGNIGSGDRKFQKVFRRFSGKPKSSSVENRAVAWVTARFARKPRSVTWVKNRELHQESDRIEEKT